MPNDEEFERAFREKFARYKVEPERGTTPERPLQESGVTLGERVLLQNVAPTPDSKIQWLRQRGYEAMYADPSGSQLAVRKAGTTPWKVVDPGHAELADILDIGDELAFGLAAGAGASAAGPLGAAGGGAATEGVRQSLGQLAGFQTTPGQVAEDIALSGAVGGATEVVLGGAGKLLRGALGRGRVATKAPTGPQVNLLEPKATVTPEGALGRRLEGMGPPAGERVIPGVGDQAGRLRELRGEGYSFRTRPAQGGPSRPSGPTGTTSTNLDPFGTTSTTGRVSGEAMGRTPGIRHTLTREEGGAIRETSEQLAPKPEQVKPLISMEEAQTMKGASLDRVIPILEKAGKDEPVFVTFMKKGTKKTGPEVRSMQVHPNAGGPGWLSEGEVRKQTSKMPLAMLRELAAEHGPAPGIVKKLYGSSKAKDLDREGLAKWLFEKQPAVVTERGGPSPVTRATENKAQQLIQFWEEFGEHTSGESAAKQARSHLKNLIEGRKESGGYRRFPEKSVLEVRVGEKVYRFDEGGEALATSSAAKQALGKVGGKLVSAAAKTPTGRALKKLVSLAERVAPETTKKAKSAIKGAVQKAAEKLPEGTAETLGRASESVKTHVRSIASTLRTRGREAAQAAAYSLMRKYPELQAWAEEEGRE